MTQNHVSTRKLTTVAILAAIAALLFMIEIPVIPAVPFYKLDLSNLPVLLGTFAMGPLAGTWILLIKSVLGLLHSSSQGVGELADFIMGLCMVLPAGFLYRRRKTRGGAIIGMVVGSVAATVAGVLTNLYILIPFYSAVYHMPLEAIIGMGQAVVPSIDGVGEFVLFITGPFNLVKWTIISVLGALIYKPLSPILHGRSGRAKETTAK